ncbi:hypothetical protein ACG83_21930 [Frankia sp. R43]|nr:hypothetical protein ACG83_21930 [Frankia sp. R43]
MELTGSAFREDGFLMARHARRRSSLWRFFAMACGAMCGLYLVLAGLEWAIESAPYLVAGLLVVAIAVVVAR